MKRAIAGVTLVFTASQMRGGDPNESTVRATLMAPLTSAFSQKGDVVSARIAEPPEWKGAMLEGEVQTVQKNNNKRTVIQITFQTLHQNAKVSAVTVNVLGLANSKNEKGHDDGGVLVEFGGAGTHKSGHRLGFGKDREGGEKDGSSGSIRLVADGSNLSLAVGSSLELELVRR